MQEVCLAVAIEIADRLEIPIRFSLGPTPRVRRVVLMRLCAHVLRAVPEWLAGVFWSLI